MFPHYRALTLLVGLPIARPVTAQQGGEQDVGGVEFDVSCAPAVQDDFDHAVALLHHMMYVESRRAFERVAERDPECAMAHWGIAMTLFQPLWPARPGPEQLARGHRALERARELGPATGRERALVAAAAAFYREPETADWWTRIRRWAAAMADAYRARPDDIETGALYALSQLAAAPVAEDRMARHAEAARVLLRIHERQPSHPGAIHYTIHANDVDARAGESLDIVRSYDDIAPSVPHALHMPTHIFVRLGEWPGVIEWNRKSADAALALPGGATVSLHYIHAVDYLVYAYLQRAADREAEAAREEALGRGPYQEDFASAFHLAALPARYAVERRVWHEASGLNPGTPEYLAWDRYPWAEALSWFARGLGRLHTGDVAAAQEAAATLGGLRSKAEQAGEQAFAGYIEIDRLVLSAWLARAEGKADSAVARLKRAAALERTVQKHPISPGALYPPYEALGDLLLELGRPAEALAAYEQSLKTWPGRYNTLLGAARAARQAGDAATAKAHYAKLLEVVGDAETTRSGVREAKEFMAAKS